MHFVKRLLNRVVTVSMMCVMALGLTACAKTDNSIKVYTEIELTTETYAFAIAKENTELKTTVNELIMEMKSDGSLDKLINSYFDGSSTFTYTNKTEQPQADDFIVATDAVFPPFEMFDGNSFTGIDMEIAYKIATKLEKNLFILHMEFETIISNIKRGESAIGMAGLSVNESRLEEVDFSDGYYTSALVVSTLASDSMFANCKNATEVEAIFSSKDKNYKVGTEIGGTTCYMYAAGDKDYGYVGFPFETKGYESGILAMEALQKGEINAVILDKQPSIMIANYINSK